MNDHERLARVRTTVADSVPDAASISLETSDQGHFGFTLTDITLADGRRLSGVDPTLLDAVTHAVEDDLLDIRWNGVVGETRQGYATLALH